MSNEKEIKVTVVDTEEKAAAVEGTTVEGTDKIEKKAVVKPNFNASQTKKKLVNISDEQRALDDMNSTLVQSKHTEKLSEKIKKQDEKALKAKEKEAKGKKKLGVKGKVIIAFFGTLAVALVVGVVVLKELNKGPEINIVSVNTEEFKGNVITEKVQSTVPEKYVAPVDTNLIGTSKIDSPMWLGAYTEETTTVNAQVVAGEGYKDYEAPRYWGLTGFESGYHKVATELSKLNSEQGTNYSIGEESDYKASEKPVMFTVDIKYPEGYPSNFGDDKVTSVPDVEIKIIGNPYVSEENTEENESSSENTEETTEENESSSDKKVVEQYTDYITHDDVEYSCNVKMVSEKPEYIDAKSGYKFKFVTTMLSGTRETDYIIEVKVGDKVEYYNGIKIE